MGVEIERKFLLDRVPPDMDLNSAVTIKQGYLAITDNAEVRLRAVGEDRSLTVKQGRGLVRREATVELDAQAFKTVWPFTENRRLSKRRVTIEYDDLVLEIDVFNAHLKGLVMVEVEFDSRSASESFVVPSWFGREVTDDPRYSNAALASSTGKP